jgi:hypothetical protein
MLDGYNYGFQKHLANKIKRWKYNKKICKAELKINLIDEIQIDVSNKIHKWMKDLEKN